MPRLEKVDTDALASSAPASPGIWSPLVNRGTPRGREARDRCSSTWRKRTCERQWRFISVSTGMDASAGATGGEIWLPLIGAVVAIDAGSEVRRGGGESSEMVGERCRRLVWPARGRRPVEKNLMVGNRPERTDAEKK